MVFRSDPCGFVCLIITYTAIFYSDYVVVKHLIMASVLSETLWGAANAVVYNVMIFLATAAHLRAVFSDPGIVPYPSTSLDFSHMHSGQHKQERSDGWTVCMKCENYRPPRAHHCRICRRCIRRMDHHCPWINNCVGELNQRYFIQFLFYIGVLSLHAVAMVVLSWMLDPGVAGKGKQIKLIHSIVLVVESMLFGMFVLAIGCDQMSSIFNDETAVEHVKKDGPRRTKRSKMVLLQEVFGRGNMCLWLWPLGMSSPVFPAERSDEYTV